MVDYLAAKHPMQNLKDVGSFVKEAEAVLSVLVGRPPSHAMAFEVLQMSDDISCQKTLPNAAKGLLKTDVIRHLEKFQQA